MKTASFKTLSIIIIFTLLLASMVSCFDDGEKMLPIKLDHANTISVATPVKIKLDSSLISEVAVFKDSNGQVNEVPSQTQGNELWFMLEPKLDTEEKITYFLKKSVPISSQTALTAHKENGDFSIQYDGKDILKYRYGMSYPPEGVDSLYRKSGYIHPILSPSGDTLTRIQAPDHYHHYGIWGPWTRTKIGDKPVDFWNLRAGQGTVLFDSFNSVTDPGPLYTSFNAKQVHLDLTAEEENQIALNENLEVRVWGMNKNKDRYVIDYTTTINSPLESGILFEAYRYGGGIGYRTTERWHKDNSYILTSEGKTRIDADGTSARWCIVGGASSDGKDESGILFLSHPNNKSHPEPMRVWPEDANGGRGDLYFQFCPIRHEEWRLESQKDYQLQYRMVVFQGKLSEKDAEAYWQSFAVDPEATIIEKESTNKE